MGGHNHCHSQGHHHHSCCCSDQCSCRQEKCHSEQQGECKEDCSDFTRKLLEMADQAWMELLKEKIKEQIQISGGSHLDQLAKTVAESNKDRWMHKMSLHKVFKDFKEKVAKCFECGCDSSCK